MTETCVVIIMEQKISTQIHQRVTAKNGMFIMVDQKMFHQKSPISKKWCLRKRGGPGRSDSEPHMNPPP